MKRLNYIPTNAKKLLQALTVARGIGLETRCKEKLDVFAWAPMVGFIYGEHAILDGHEALLFKWDQFVGVGMVIDRRVAGLHFRLRGVPGHNLCWFKGKHRDFVPEMVLEDGETERKLELIEELLKWYVEKYVSQLTQKKSRLSGRVWVYHISTLYPGTGLNWSGASAIAISEAIHKLLGIQDLVSIRRLAYLIEYIYHGGAASGYGAIATEEGPYSLYLYRLTPLGIENRKKLTEIWSLFIKESISKREKWFAEMANLALCKDGLFFRVREGTIVRKLKRGEIPGEVKEMFHRRGVFLSEKSYVEQTSDNEWRIVVDKVNKYIIQKEVSTLNIYEYGAHFHIKPAIQAREDSRIAFDVANLFQKKKINLSLIYTIPKSTAAAINHTKEKLKECGRDISDWRRSLNETVKQRNSISTPEALFDLINEVQNRLCKYTEKQNKLSFETGLGVKEYDILKETLKKKCGLSEFGFKLTGGGAGGTVCIFTKEDHKKKTKKCIHRISESYDFMVIKGSLTAETAGAQIGKRQLNLVSILSSSALVLILSALIGIVTASFLNKGLSLFWTSIIVATMPFIAIGGTYLYRVDAREYPGPICLALDPFFRFTWLNILARAFAYGLTFTGLVSLIYLLIEIFSQLSKIEK